MALPQMDDFAGTGALSANWTTAIGDPARSSGVMVSNIGTSVAYWSADSFNADHYSQCKLVQQYGGPVVRWSGTSGYLCSLGAGGAIYRVDAGSFTSIGSPSSDPSANDILKMEAVADDVKVYINGVIKATIAQGTYDTGAGGVNAFAGTTAQIDDWQGGNTGSASAVTQRAQFVRQAVNRAATY